MNLLNVNVADLAKVDKLLDRIENEMKKKRTENFYTSPEKYANYMNKTAELYSLISEEVISFLDIIGLGDFIHTFQKLFRGLQQQVHSMLKFTLYYYNARSLQVREAMIRGKFPVEGSGDSNVKPPASFAMKIQKTNLSGQPMQVQTARDRTFPTLGVPNHPYITGSIVSPSDPGSAKMFLGSPSTARSAHESNYLSAEQDEGYEIEGYQVEYSQIKHEIDELLEAKENILKIQPTTLALNLKQVLRSLENTKRNTKVIIDESDEELEDEIDLENMIKKLMKACTDAQKKTFQKIIDYFRNTKSEGQVLFRKDQATMPDPKILDLDKKIMKREFEALVQLKQQEVNFLKKRVEAIEQDRDVAEEKYSKLQIEHSTCEQEKRDTALQISALEAEIAQLREAFHEGRKARMMTQNSQSPGLPNVDSPSLKPQSSLQASQEVSRKMMEQMGQYRSEIEALKSELREERKARMLHLNTMESNLMSGAPSPVKSPMRMSQFDAGKPSSSVVTPSVMKSTVREKFAFDEKATKGEGRGTRADSMSLSRKPSYAKQENNSNVMPHTPKDVRKPNMPHGESEFKKMKNTPSLYVDYDPNKIDYSQHEDAEHRINNEGHSGSIRDPQGSQRSLLKIDHKESSFKGDGGSQPSTKRENASLRGIDSKQNSPPSTLTKISGNDRAQTEDKNSKSKATNKGTEKANAAKGVAKNNDKRRTSISQEHAQVIKPAALNDTVENNEQTTSINNLGPTSTKASAANAQKGKKTVNAKKPKGTSQETKEISKPEDEYLLKDGTNPKKEKKETSISMEKRELPSTSRRNVPQEDKDKDKTRGRSICVDKAVQTDELAPISFRDNKRNLSLSKEAYNKPYNLISPIQKEMRSASGFESGLNAIHSQSELKHARDSSESRLANLVKADPKPKVGKSHIPSFDGKFKHPLSVLEDKSINEDSARNTRFPTDVDHSAERIYSDVEIYPRNHGKGSKTNLKKTDRAEKEMLLPGQGRSSSSNSPLKPREDHMGHQEGDDAQMNAMFKAMMAKAEQDPKILSIMKNYARDKGESIDEEDEFMPDYNLFVDYINNLRIAHQRCGENCSHLQRFYARIGYYHIWNKRSPLAMGKPDIVEEYAKKSKLPSRLPNIPEKKVLKMAS